VRESKKIQTTFNVSSLDKHSFFRDRKQKNELLSIQKKTLTLLVTNVNFFHRGPLNGLKLEKFSI
jgi:hypothetical protein